MSKHTPGPWKIAPHCSTLIENDSGRSICSAGGFQSNVNPHMVLAENEANASLIAAAPELLEALKELLRADELPPDDTNLQRCVDAMQTAREVIAKAEGET